MKPKGRRKAGLCWDCHNKAARGKTRCRKHLTNDAATSRKYRHSIRKEINEFYQKRRRERLKKGLCTHCGRPLDKELDGGYKCCVLCRNHLERPMGVDIWS